MFLSSPMKLQVGKRTKKASQHVLPFSSSAQRPRIWSTVACTWWVINGGLAGSKQFQLVLFSTLLLHLQTPQLCSVPLVGQRSIREPIKVNKKSIKILKIKRVSGSEAGRVCEGTVLLQTTGHRGRFWNLSLQRTLQMVGQWLLGRTCWVAEELPKYRSATNWWMAVLEF